ncbi:MAG: glycerophosphodiester phosphodiesterase family protein [Actinomycetes bacterium]
MNKLIVALTTVMATAAFPALSSAAPYNWLKFNSTNHKPLIMAHQGGEDENPSNTMYAFKKAIKDGATALELDIGVTKDGQVIVMHDTTVDRVTNGTGNTSDLNLAQIKALDGAYWFSASAPHYSHDKPASAYPFRGFATGAKALSTTLKRAGYKASDFKVATLNEVLAAFPRTPINIEIKGRTPTEATSEYTQNAEVLANLLKNSSRRDIVVVSFRQEAVDRFNQVAPNIPTAPGITGDYQYLFSNFASRKIPSPQTVAIQVPNSYVVNGFLANNIANCDWIGRAHTDGYAWHQWFGNDDLDDIGNGISAGGKSDGGWKYLLDRRIDGIMTAKPKKLATYMKKTYKWTKASNICMFKGGGGY